MDRQEGFPSPDELERWATDPKSWEGLSDRQFVFLLVSRILLYGQSNDEALIPGLMRLYANGVKRFEPERRIDMLEEVTSQVEDGGCSVNALLPFIMMDSAIHIVSSAALNLAVLMPLEDGNFLTGPEYLLSTLRAGTTADATVHVGVLSGLLMLGDRRVVALLDHCWDELSTEDQLALAKARSGIAHAPVIEFLLDWLDDLDDERESEVFGAVAAALARIPTEAHDFSVVEVRRKFTVNRGASPEIEFISKWSVAEFGETIRPRLIRRFREEREPRILGYVLRAWGQPEPPLGAARPFGNGRAGRAAAGNPEPEDRETLGSATHPRPRRALAQYLRAFGPMILYMSAIVVVSFLWGVYSAWSDGDRGAALRTEALKQLIETFSIVLLVGVGFVYLQILVVRNAPLLFAGGALNRGPLTTLLLSVFVIATVTGWTLGFTGDYLRHLVDPEMETDNSVGTAMFIGCLAAIYCSFLIYAERTDSKRTRTE